MGLFQWLFLLAFYVFWFSDDRFNEGVELKVLHDWDQVLRSKSWTLRRGISLVVYSLSIRIPFLNIFHAVLKNKLKIEKEELEYMETLIKLDKIAGIIPVFGIRDNVRERYGDRIDELQKRYNLDIRRHIHIGANNDPNRKRIWEPQLERQTPNSWHFDLKYMQGIKMELQLGELPIFHIDRPNLLSVYIDYLFEEMIKNCHG